MGSVVLRLVAQVRPAGRLGKLRPALLVLTSAAASVTALVLVAEGAWYSALRVLAGAILLLLAMLLA